MKLQFITSITQGYWNGIGKHCIDTWNLPGEIVIYIDQQEGEVEWFNEIAHTKKLIHVPPLKTFSESSDDDDETSKTKTKTRKFWGKACAQIHAVRNREPDTRVIWLDADVEQIKPFSNTSLFDWSFQNPVALMKSNDWSLDCWETGLVIFNEKFEKMEVFLKRYENFWKDREAINSLHKPYDAMVLGAVATEYKAKFYNLCNAKSENVNALQHTIFRHHFKHWINKTNKEALKEKITHENG